MTETGIFSQKDGRPFVIAVSLLFYLRLATCDLSYRIRLCPSLANSDEVVDSIWAGKNIATTSIYDHSPIWGMYADIYCVILCYTGKYPVN